jgi:hypothetical protein
MLRVGRQMGVFGSSEDGVVAEYFLHLKQIDARLDQMGGIAVAQAVRGNLFFKPQSTVT